MTGALRPILVLQRSIPKHRYSKYYQSHCTVSLKFVSAMFATGKGDSAEGEQQSASTAATEQVKLWETIIGLRISLQRSLDTSNKLPGSDFLSSAVSYDKACRKEVSEVKGSLKGLLGDLNYLLDVQAKDNGSTKKRKINEEINWEDIVRTQDKFRPSWESTVNKWHARLHFGSEQVKSKMKVFNQTIWEQIDVALNDESRVIEKSRVPWEESKRLDKNLEDDTDAIINSESDGQNDFIGDEEGEKSSRRNSGNANRRFDKECYDDRPFYSMLLKSFISSASGTGAGQGAQNMSNEDLAALRKFRKSKTNIDRKASKGRKIRYTRHPKLENFMFPVARTVSTSAFRSEGDPGSNSTVDSMSSSAFYRSLFQ